MKKIITFHIFALFLYGENTGYPDWFFQNEIKDTVPVCVKIEASVSTARTIAITKAKAELQRMSEVHLQSEVILEKEKDNKIYNSSYKEVIKQNAEGLISGYEILKSDLFVIDEKQNICILYGKQEKLVGEK